MERVGDFGGKADQLNAYFTAGGGPDYFAEDLARYTSLAPSDVQAAAIGWLPADRRGGLVVPREVKKYRAPPCCGGSVPSAPLFSRRCRSRSSGRIARSRRHSSRQRR